MLRREHSTFAHLKDVIQEQLDVHGLHVKFRCKQNENGGLILNILLSITDKGQSNILDVTLSVNVSTKISRTDETL